MAAVLLGGIFFERRVLRLEQPRRGRGADSRVGSEPAFHFRLSTLLRRRRARSFFVARKFFGRCCAGARPIRFCLAVWSAGAGVLSERGYFWIASASVSFDRGLDRIAPPDRLVFLPASRRSRCSRISAWCRSRLPSSRSACCRFWPRRSLPGSRSFSTTRTGACRNSSSRWCRAFPQIPGGHLYVERPHWPNERNARSPCSTPARARPFICARVARTGFSTPGSARDYEALLRDYLHSRGIDRLDGLVLSHGDSLHLGGAAPTLEEFHPRQFLDNAAPDRSRVHHALLVRHPALACARRCYLDLAASVRAEILFPPAGFQSESGR